MDGRCCHFLHLPITVSAICLDSFITGYTCAGMAGYCCSLCLTAEWTECLIDVCHRSKIPSPSRWRRIFDGASKWKINDGITVQSQFSPPPPSLSLSFLFFLNPANPGRSQSIPVNPSQSQSIPVNPLNPINTVNPLDPVDPVSQFNPQSFFRQVPVPSSVAGSEQKYEDWASMLLWLKQRCELFQRCYIF